MMKISSHEGTPSWSASTKTKRMLSIAKWPIGVVLALLIGAGFASIATREWQRVAPTDTVTPVSLVVIASIALYISVLLGLLLLSRIMRQHVSVGLLGIHWLRWRDIGLGIGAFIVYLIAASTVMMGVKMIAPDIDAQQQDIGFSEVYGSARMMAFIAIALIAPIVEEVVFRGYLYGGMRRSGANIIVSALVTSLLFALVHGQLNVGIVVFFMSITACMLREYTGSIWPGIIVHILQNSMAFYALFVMPKGVA